MDAYPKDCRQLQKFGDAYVKKSRETDSLMMLGFAQAMQPISPPDSLIHSPTSSPMTLSAQHMVVVPPSQVSVGLHAMMGPNQQVGVTQPQLLSSWLQSGAFAQANPLTMPMWGQAAAAQP